MMTIDKLRECAGVLRAAGLTEAAILAMFGNWQCESMLDAFRVEPDLSEEALPSRAYVAKILSGELGRIDFAQDQRGFGLAQWTYHNFSTGQGRKLDLYDFWKRSGRSIDDPVMQTEFCVWELNNREWRAILPELQKSDNLYYLTDLICKRYEMPAFNNVGERYNAAMSVKKLLEEQDEVTPPCDEDGEQFWPPRTICKDMTGPDVAVAQSILWARGYTNSDTVAVFGGQTDKITRRFQAANGLAADGIIGPLTWAALLGR